MDAGIGEWGHINVDDFIFTGASVKTRSEAEEREHQKLLKNVKVSQIRLHCNAGSTLRLTANSLRNHCKINAELC